MRRTISAISRSVSISHPEAAENNSEHFGGYSLSDPIVHYVFSQWNRISPSALDLIIVYHSRRKKFKYFRPRPQNSNIFGGKGNDTTTLRLFFKLKLPIFTHFLDKFFDYETL